MLIEFAGIDGAGKTTQAQKLKKYIQSITMRNVKTIHGFKPYKYTSELNSLCKKQYKKSSIFSTLCSFVYFLDAADVFHSKIEPVINDGGIVITDKYITNSLVYAPIMGCDEEIIRQFRNTFYIPDLIIFLKITPQVAYERILNRGKQIQEKESLEIMRKADKAFRELLCGKAIIIDANDSPENVHNKIINELKIMYQ